MADPLKKHRAPHCSACGGYEAACGPDAAVVICTRCTVGAAVKAQESQKDCPGCGEREIAGDLDLCPVCIRKAEKAERAAALRARNERAARRFTEAAHV